MRLIGVNSVILHKDTDNSHCSVILYADCRFSLDRFCTFIEKFLLMRIFFSLVDNHISAVNIRQKRIILFYHRVLRFF